MAGTLVAPVQATTSVFSMFRTHPANINQIKAAIDVYGSVWFHGDGNIYPVDDTPGKDHSTNAVNFTNPMGGRLGNLAAGAYRVKFTSKSQVPSTVEGINALLMTAKGKEMQEANKPKSSKFGNNIVGPYVETDEDKYQPAPQVDNGAAELRAQLAEARAQIEMMKAAPPKKDTSPAKKQGPAISEPVQPEQPPAAE